MKKIVAVCFYLCVALTALVAQQQNHDNSFVKTTRVTNITPHTKGYIVSYIKDNGKVATVLMPIEWFTPNDGLNADLLFMDSPQYPAFSIFYRDGSPSQIKLYAMRRPTDLTWGTVNKDSRFDEAFAKMKDNPQFVF